MEILSNIELLKDILIPNKELELDSLEEHINNINFNNRKNKSKRKNKKNKNFFTNSTDIENKQKFINYSWENENFITEYAKKEKLKKIYLACTKSRNNGKYCPGKAKFIKNSGEVIIYEKCNNSNNKHYKMNYENLKNFFI